MSIELCFKKNVNQFTYADCYGVKCYVAEAPKETVDSFFQERQAVQLGSETIMMRTVNDEAKHETLVAFIHEGSLFVCRTIDTTTTVYNYSAGASILVAEAFQIWSRHCEVSRLD